MCFRSGLLTSHLSTKNSVCISHLFRLILLGLFIVINIQVPRYGLFSSLQLRSSSQIRVFKNLVYNIFPIKYGNQVPHP
jgi:hypothetical protein